MNTFTRAAGAVCLAALLTHAGSGCQKLGGEPAAVEPVVPEPGPVPAPSPTAVPAVAAKAESSTEAKAEQPKSDEAATAQPSPEIDAHHQRWADRFAPLLEPVTEGGPKKALEGIAAAKDKLRAKLSLARYKFTLRPEGEQKLLKACSAAAEVETLAVPFIQFTADSDPFEAALREEVLKAVEAGHPVSAEVRKLVADGHRGHKQPPLLEHGSIGYTRGDIDTAARHVRAQAVGQKLSGDELFSLLEAVADCGHQVVRGRERLLRLHVLASALPAEQRMAAIDRMFGKHLLTGINYGQERGRLEAKRPYVPGEEVMTMAQRDEPIRKEFPAYKKALEKEFLALETKKRAAFASVFRADDETGMAALGRLDDLLEELQSVFTASVPEFGYRFKPLRTHVARTNPKADLLPTLTLPGNAEDDVPEILITETGWAHVTIRPKAKRSVTDKELLTWDGCTATVSAAVTRPKEEYPPKGLDRPSLVVEKRLDAALAFERMLVLPSPQDAKTRAAAVAAMTDYLDVFLDSVDDPPYLRILRGERVTKDQKPAGLLARAAALELLCRYRSHVGNPYSRLRNAVGSREAVATAVHAYCRDVLRHASESRQTLSSDEVERLTRAAECGLETRETGGRTEMVEAFRGATYYLPKTEESDRLRAVMNR